MALHIEESKTAPRYARPSPIGNVLSGLLVPVHRLHVILRHRISIFVHLCHANLRVHVTLFRSPEEPFKSFLMVTLHIAAISVIHPQDPLCVGLPVFRRKEDVPPSTTESGKKPREDFSQAAVRMVEEATEKH